MRDGWPAWAAHGVEVVDPDPAWAPLAATLSADLQLLLTPWLEGDVEHVGSTAVPGLVAKPVIDLMAPVNSLVDSERADDVLAVRGWHLVPPLLDRRPYRRMYVLPEATRRLAHLHLVEPAHPRWRETLMFRDRLRRDPELAAQYARIKRLAAQAHPTDREAYTQAKTAFVHEVIAPDRHRAPGPSTD